jgi:hypothetical protein
MVGQLDQAAALHVFVDGRAWLCVAAPAAVAPRAWLLGVVAVQAALVDERLACQVRAHLTGGESPALLALTPPALVQVQLAEGAPQLPLPGVAAPALDGARARIALFLDDEPLAEVALPRGAAAGARAFGHVYCRWLRDGGIEPGFDLTDFLALPPGRKYERVVQRALGAGHTVSYAIAA